MRRACAGLLALTALALGQDQQAGTFEAEIKVTVRLDYLLFVPKAAANEKLPLIFFLHGAGERGRDLEIVKRHGPPKIVEQKKDFPFIVLSPQCAGRAWWEPDSLVHLLDDIIARHPVDPDRVYLTGLSMGGYGAWALAAKYPDRFAAIAPICGGGDVRTAPRMKDLPIWVFHGARDRVVRLSQSREMVTALKVAGNDARFTIYPEAGHDAWTRTYDNHELYQWFLKHRRGTRPQPAAGDVSSKKFARVGPAVQALVDGKKIAGAVTMVAHRGKVVHTQAFGAMKKDTIFRIYSMSKPITSVAAMILFEEGKFALDDPVAKHLPELAKMQVYKSGTGEDVESVPPGRAMTVRDLLRHTSGLTYGFFGNTPVDQMYRRAGLLADAGTLEQMVPRLAKLPLLSHPGTQFTYSVSTDVLGHLVEKWSGQPLDVFFKQRIFEPLGMDDTGFFVPAGKLARFCKNYGPGQDGLRVVDDPQTSRYRRKQPFLSGGGGLVSTAADYMAFCRMLLGGGELDGTRILKEETVALMTRNHVPQEALPIRMGPMPMPGLGFGLGFSVIMDEKTGRVGEYGWGGAASTHFWISPRDDLAVVALQQHMPFSLLLEATIKPLIYDALR